MYGRRLRLFVIVLLCAGAGCRQRGLPAKATPSPDNEYLDLAAGGRLSITVPRLKSGGYVARLHAVEASHGVFTVSGDDFIGFEVSRYAVLGKPDGRVRLKFELAESARDGKLTSKEKAPGLPFALPRG